MIDDYDDLNVSEVRKAVTDIDDAAELEELLGYEEDNKDRKTAKDAIEERLDAVDTDGDEDASAEAESDSEDADDGPIDSDEYITVRAARGHSGHLAGFSFEPGEAKTIKATPRVQRALSRGKLQRIS